MDASDALQYLQEALNSCPMLMDGVGYLLQAGSVTLRQDVFVKKDVETIRLFLILGIGFA